MRDDRTYITEPYMSKSPKGQMENDMGEPTYEEQIPILAMFLANADIEYQTKEDLIKAFCKKFDKTEEELLRDLKGE